MLTIEVKGTGEEATRVADRLKLFALAPSLGGVESLVTQPCTTTHHGLTPRRTRPTRHLRFHAATVDRTRGRSRPDCDLEQALS